MSIDWTSGSMTVTQYAGPAGAGQRYQITAPGGYLQLSADEMAHLAEIITRNAVAVLKAAAADPDCSPWDANEASVLERAAELVNNVEKWPESFAQDRAREQAVVSAHRGIELRATLAQAKPNGLIMLANSDVMHLQALMGSPTALADESGWTETLPPVADGQGRPWLLIEHRAVMLPDYVPDPEREDHS